MFALLGLSVLFGGLSVVLKGQNTKVVWQNSSLCGYIFEVDNWVNRPLLDITAEPFVTDIPAVNISMCRHMRRPN